MIKLRDFVTAFDKALNDIEDEDGEFLNSVICCNSEEKTIYIKLYKNKEYHARQ